MGSKRRILFLSDSVAKSTPEHLFSRVKKDHRCVKKVNFYLTDVFNFEPEFGYSDDVLISCGINDMSTAKDGRPPVRAHVLADLTARRLTECCDRHPNTSFIINSILHTRHQWLNREVDTFNRVMFELSVTIHNLRFLDSHEGLMRDSISETVNDVLDPSDPRGTHLTFAAKKLITKQLVSAVELIVGKRTGTIQESTVRGWSWPLRREYVAVFRDISASFVKDNR